MKRFPGLVALGVLSACGAGAEDKTSAETGVEPVVSASASPQAAEAGAAARTSTSSVDCQAGEETIFSCKTGGGKRIAVCTGAGGKTEYRYGTGSPELVIEGGRFASVPYSGGGEAQLALDNGATRYVVFSRVVRTNFAPGEPNDPAISDGVIVLRGNKVLAALTCDDPDVMPVQLDAAARHLPRDGELFTYETGRADSK